ncbi:MAG: hypothetical protein J6B55_06685, partial [Clostridia bacterium]|nr:hypothetical protein [Clostridia bacterium]
MQTRKAPLFLFKTRCHRRRKNCALKKAHQQAALHYNISFNACQVFFEIFSQAPLKKVSANDIIRFFFDATGAKKKLSKK